MKFSETSFLLDFCLEEQEIKKTSENKTSKNGTFMVKKSCQGNPTALNSNCKI
jgi:hypothetical protein